MAQIITFRRRVALAFFLALSACCGFWLGRTLFGPTALTIDTSRVEACIQAYSAHRKGGSSEELLNQLKRNNISPREFEYVIDRIIHFRISQSSLEQIRHLLEVIRLGNGIRPEKVVTGEPSGMNTFFLDAAIMTLFQDKPALIHQVFGG